MSDKICIFAGTTEGRKLARLLSRAAEVTACVATEYGEVMLDGIEGISVHTGRMDENEMTAFFAREAFARIIDATHPYAQIVTENIAAAAKARNIPVMRILREEDRHVGRAVYVSSVPEARDWLTGREGNVFLTTGAKELSEYVGLDMTRVWARVLPSVSSLEACERAGIPMPHIIAAQGPFSYEINLAQLKTIGARYMVTKASGKNGGFEDKINAALDAGAVPVIIGQPPQVSGLTLDEAVEELEKSYPIAKRKIWLIGAGPGAAGCLTADARDALNDCDAVIGARQVVSTIGTGKLCFYEYLPAKVRSVLDGHASIRRAAVVLRGDTGFFSGARNLAKEFSGEDVTVIPGISSISVFAAKLGTAWDDAALVSMHGRACNIVRTVDANPHTFALTGGENTAEAICRKLCLYGLGTLRAAVAEKLSYPDEKITCGSVEELSSGEFDPLAVLYVENPDAARRLRVGIPDDEFIRGDVPMTKSEIRAVSVSKLELTQNAVIWDIGAGTGSVSVECALASNAGKVYAVEKKPEACELIRQNAARFRTDNIEVIEGSAPEALAGLSAPTNVFIGGSDGKLREILTVLLDKNPEARIVVNTVTLETLEETLACAREFGFGVFEAVSVNIARSRKLGRYNMMTAQNPVHVFTMQKGEKV